MDKKGLVMLGCGGHSSACLDVIESFNTYSISMNGRVSVDKFIPDTRLITSDGWDQLCSEYGSFILGVGQIHDAVARKSIVSEVKRRGGSFVTLISPHATVTPNCRIGEGTVVMSNAMIGRGVSIGSFCIINTGSIIEHGASVGDYTHISTGAVINGDCRIGTECFVGSNAVLLNQIEIDSGVSVGAGSVVTKNLKGGAIYVGNPASFLRLKD